MAIFIFLGIIQGLTEFLPVSSSGQLYLLRPFITVATDFLPFVVWVHVATLCAVLAFFRKDFVSLLRDRRIILYIAVITMSTVFIGIALERFLKPYFGNRFLLSSGFIITAAVLFWGRAMRGHKELRQMTILQTIVLGIAQGIAVIPGISRSGVTISVLTRMGFKPHEAFRMSFIMAAPVIAGAFLYKSSALIESGVSAAVLVTGFAFSFFAGIAALFILQKMVSRHIFYRFGYYCMVLGIIVLFV